MKNIKVIKTLLSVLLLASMALSNTGYAAFPDDFSDVTWLDSDISSWQQTSNLTVSVNSTATFFTHTKQASWPNTTHSIVGRCCNASVWAFIKRNGRWYASTFEYLRPNTPRKFTSALDGAHIKRAPFLRGQFDWKPADGEVYGFMVSGFARFNLNDVNIRERSNVFFYKWGEGPSNANGAKNFTEVPRQANGSPGIDEPEEPAPSPEPEECVVPEPPVQQVNTHNYSGTASGTVVISGPVSQTLEYSEVANVKVSDDRSVTVTIDDESFNSTVESDGTFAGTFTFDILGQCLVDINVNGLVDGRSVTGTSRGSETCAINGPQFTATFNASFDARSNTTPDYLDEREVVNIPDPCREINLLPIMSLLLND